VAVSICAPGTIGFGRLLVYQLRVSNDGPAPATGVRAMVSFLFALSIQNSGSCVGAFGSYSMRLRDARAGSERLVVFRLRGDAGERIRFRFRTLERRLSLAGTVEGGARSAYEGAGVALAVVAEPPFHRIKVAAA
jgi:hypothetical protein